MRVVTVDVRHPDPAVIAEAALLIRAGELVAFPTETVYGLGANALDPDAVGRIFETKGRPAWNPVIVHVADTAQARVLAANWPTSAARLAERCWPGPLTLVVPRSSIIPNVVAAGGDTVGLRMPAHRVALALIEAAGCPIAAPSANRFTQVSPTTAGHVLTSLGNSPGLVLDGGPCTVGIESTVVDCTEDAVSILRPGMIGINALTDALEGMDIVVRNARPQHLSGCTRGGGTGEEIPAPRSPGMTRRHYAPHADVWLFYPTDQERIATALVAYMSGQSSRRPVVGLLRSVDFGDLPMTVVRMPDDPAQYAQELYAALHEADARGASIVFIEMPPAGAEWDGIRDRLTRASHEDML